MTSLTWIRRTAGTECALSRTPSSTIESGPRGRLSCGERGVADLLLCFQIVKLFGQTIFIRLQSAFALFAAPASLVSRCLSPTASWLPCLAARCRSSWRGISPVGCLGLCNR